MSNRFSTLFVFLTALVLVEGCATTQQSTSSNGNTTVADARLQTDVMRMIGIYEPAAGGSSSPRLVSAKNIGKEGSSFIERWVVDSNGKNITYSVKLTPSPRGGADYAIARLPE